MSIKKIFIVLTVAGIYFTLNFAFLSNEGYTSMEDYIESTKDEFSYEIEEIIYKEEWTGYHIKMISGEWLDNKKVSEVNWWHNVDIIIPKEVKTSSGIMFIDNGVSSENYFRLDDEVINYSNKLGAIIVNVSNIPFQPVNFLESNQESFLEDDLIAFAWNKFLKSGGSKKDLEWLPRLPMTRAVVRSMDLAQEIAIQNNIQLDNFVVSGASKRGWTAWTTAAVDKRVVGVVPMVIDLLNVIPSFENHYRSYGEFSLAVQEYVNYEIPDWMQTDEFKTLLEYVEPYSFKESFTMPKYIINAGSDEFFSTDSWQYYYDELPGNKLLRYVPNRNHSLDGRYLNDDLVSYFNRIVNDAEMPELNWKLNEDYLEATIDYDGDYSVSLWVAENSDGRDFRLWMEGELWIQSPIKKSKDGNYSVEIKAEENKYKAVMLVFIVDPNSGFPLIISTGPYVVPETYPFQKYKPKKPN